MVQKSFLFKILGVTLLSLAIFFVYQISYAFIQPTCNPPNCTGSLGSLSTGNLSIGTTNPEGLFQIASSTATNVKLVIERADVYKSAILRFNTTGAGSDWSVGLLNGGGAISNGWGISKTNLVSDAKFILTDGAFNVGIGTTNPTSKLEVAGDINIIGGGTLKVNGSAFSGSQWTTSGSNLYFGTGGVGIGLTSPDANYRVTTSGGGIKSESTSQPAGYFNSTTGYGLLVNTGNVGIGTTAPLAKLDVSGGAIMINTTIANPGTRPAVGNTRISGEINGYTSNSADAGFLRLSAGGGTSGSAKSFIDLSGYNSAADLNENIVLGTNGAEKMRIDSTGKVGIGTSAPAKGLEISTGANTAQLRISHNTIPATYYTEFGDNGVTTFARNTWSAGVMANWNTISAASTWTDAQSGGFQFLPRGVAALTILGTGNVGIGTTNPIYSLDLYNSTGASTVRIGSSSNYSNYLGMGTNGNNSNERIGVSGSAGTFVTTDHLYDWVFNNGDSSNTIFGMGGAEKMRIQANGNVGIGTTVPNARLSLGTGTQVKSLVYDGGTVAQGGNGLFAGFGIDMPANSFTMLAHNGGFLSFGKFTNNNDLAAVSEFMRITNGGNVGIGTTNPTYKLQVNGTFDATTITQGGLPIGAGGWTTGTGSIYTTTLTDKVGIGTTAPKSSLQVGNLMGLFDGGNPSLMNNAYYSSGWKYAATGYASMMQQTGAGNIDFYTAGSGTADAAISWGNQKVTIQNSGNVGIGVTSPDSNYKITTTAGGIKAENSSASQPSIYASNAGGGPSLVIGSGNVGIGITNPGNSLDIAGSYPRLSLKGGTGGSQIGLASSAGNDAWDISAGFIAPAASLHISEAVSSLPRVTIATGGNVGIGTTIPVSKLDFGTSVANQKLIIGTYTTGNYWSGIGMDTTSAGLRIAGDNSSSALLLTDIGYYSNDVSHNWTSRMVVQNGGNVGIGTTAPVGTLDVLGSTVYMRQSGLAHGMTAIAPTDANLKIAGDASGNTQLIGMTDTDVAAFTIYGINGGATQTNASIRMLAGKSSGVGWAPLSATSPAFEVTNYSTNLMMMLGGGAVGFGVTSPDANYKLTTTAGGIKAENSSATQPAGYFDNGSTGPDIQLGTGGIKFGDGTTQTTAGGGWTAGTGKVYTTTLTDSVGIGTTAPTAKLDVAGTYNISVNPSYAGYQEIPAGTNFYTGSGSLSFLAKETAGLKTSIIYYGAPNYYSALEVANTASGLGNLLLMKSGGNVGIGITNPAAKLDIYEPITSVPLNSVLKVEGYANDVNEGPFIDFHERWVGAYPNWIVGRIGAVYDSSVSNGGALVFYTAGANDAASGAGATAERMRVTPSGGLSVGLTGTDTNYKIVTTAGGVKAENSSASQPSIYASNAGGGPSMVTGTGSVGIGVTNPSYKLMVTGATDSTVAYFSDGTNTGLGVIPGASGLTLKSDGTTNLKFGDGSDVNMTILGASGNVGIGTTAPATPFHVKGSSVSWRSMLNIEGGTSDSSIGLTLYNGPTAATNLMGKLDYDAGTAKTMTLANYNNGTGGDISINTFGATKNVYIATGNVGIGLTAPTQKLDIYNGAPGLPATSGTAQTYGSLRMRSSSNAVVDMGMAGASTGFWIQGGDKTDLSPAYAYPIMLQPNGGVVAIGLTSPDTNYKLTTTAGGVKAENSSASQPAGYFNNGSTGPSLVTGTGNVGIGITNPAHKLDVNGNLKVGDNLIISGNNSYKVYQNLASIDNYGGPIGSIVVDTNIPFTAANMFTITIKGYGYGAGGPMDMTVSAYAGEGNIYSAGYISTNKGQFPAPILARNTGTGKIAVILGTVGNTYPYQLNISEFTQGFTDRTEAYADGWTITVKSSLATYDYQTTCTDRTTFVGTSTGLVQSTIAGNSYLTGGNVGIGTTAPPVKLAVGAVAAISPYGMIGIKQTSALPYNGIWIESSTNDKALTLGHTGTYASIHTNYSISGPYSNLALNEYGGNVGIGTTAPGNLLTVNGTIQGTTLYATTQVATSLITADYLSGGANLSLAAGSTSGFMAFSTAGEKMRITTGGNVGIGTTAPGNKLEISGSTPSFINVINTGTSYLGMQLTGVSTGGMYMEGNAAQQLYAGSLAKAIILGNATSNSIQFAPGNSVKMTLLAGGNVGIGTTAPGALLALSGAATVGISNAPTLLNVLSTDSQAVNMGGGIMLGGVYTGTSQTSFGYIGGLKENGTDNDYSGRLVLGARANGGSGADMTRMTILGSNGNVGIGTSNPLYKLDISTDANDQANNSYIRFDTHNTPGSQSSGILWRGNYTGYTKESAAIRAMTEGDYFRLGLGFFTGNNQDSTTNATEKMRINMDGNVGIGLTSPDANYKLTVGTQSLANSGVKAETTSATNPAGYFANAGGGAAIKVDSGKGVIQAGGGFIMETRTSDPGSPVAGQIWLRTDL